MGKIIMLAREMKKQRCHAINEMITLFEPKIKKSSQTAPQRIRNDLEQELRWQIVKAVDHFQEPSAPDFWGTINKKKIDYTEISNYKEPNNSEPS